MELFSSGKADRVELLYHHFNRGLWQGDRQIDFMGQYLCGHILEMMVKQLNLTIYTTLLDTTTSEHAARMMAMQTGR